MMGIKTMEKYSSSTMSIDNLLAVIPHEIAIPEIQRPFVWKPKQVRDLIDSLYTGYPTGYLIISQDPKMRLKDGTCAEGRKILIDGQQRITALMTAIKGIEVLNSDFEKKRIKISFNPFANTDEGEESFKVQDNAILKDKRWIPDIAEIFSPDFKHASFVHNYCKNNPEMDPDQLHDILDNLKGIKNRQLGVILLNKDLTIDEVTEIFIRINSQGKKLNQADFAMSKIAANTTYNGNLLRKAIDYFSHLAVQPEWYSEMKKDKEFTASSFANQLKWLKNDHSNIYDPDYGDILRVALMYSFGRGRMKDLVSLLGGRDFETRDYKEEIAEKSFQRLTEGVSAFMNKNCFLGFIMTIQSIGFISPKLLNSQITMDFAYTLYLLLHKDSSINKTKIKRYIAKWFVLTSLTGRYITSPESAMDRDLRRIAERGFPEFFKEIENAELSETFWTIGLVQNLETTAINSPSLNVFFAAQVFGNDKSLLSSNIEVRYLITDIGDVHHVFPKKYLSAHGVTEKSKYNQIANYIYLDTTINKTISDQQPGIYFATAFNQCRTGNVKIGDILDENDLKKNLATNCIPQCILDMNASQYEEFLLMRRTLMAQKIRQYYDSL
ncbi:MAG: DUF262 domain-containing protein [Planctomycetia bacterium]|nr:DUF262 domain-containing protein [Planctomycetia bacterium]